MKIFTAIILIFSLSGCATINNLYDSYFMAPYDTNEHFLVNKIKVHSELSKPFCSDHEAAKISAKNIFTLASELKNFSNHLENNVQTIKMTELLFVLTEEFYKRYENNSVVNITYCQLKLQSISDSAKTIQKSIAKRPRS